MKFPGSDRGWELRLQRQRRASYVSEQRAYLREQRRLQREWLRDQRQRERESIRLENQHQRESIRLEKQLQRDAIKHEKELKLQKVHEKNAKLEEILNNFNDIFLDAFSTNNTIPFESLLKKDTFSLFTPPPGIANPLQFNPPSDIANPLKYDSPTELYTPLKYFPPATLVNQINLPNWADYEIKPLNKFAGFIPFIKSYHQKKEQTAKSMFREAMKKAEKAEEDRKQNLGKYKQEFEKAEEERKQNLEKYKQDLARAEEDRKRQLNKAKMEHEENERKFIKEIEDFNQNILRTKEAYFSGDALSIVKYNEMVLNNSIYPDGIMQKYNLEYIPTDGLSRSLLLISFEMPSEEIIPTVKKYNYFKTKDTVDETPMSNKEKSKIYKKMIISIALRTIYEICNADQGNVVDGIGFYGFKANSNLEHEEGLITMVTIKEIFLDVIDSHSQELKVDELATELNAEYSDHLP